MKIKLNTLLIILIIKKSTIDKNRKELISKIRTILNNGSQDYNYYLGELK